MRITVCALTYKRPKGLTRLLEGLGKLSFHGAGPACACLRADTHRQACPHADRPDLTVVIVDNDPEGSARETCERAGERFPWTLKYVIEPKRGIAHGRNAALDEVCDAEWVAFIDDDEVPPPEWLEELLRVQAEYGADVVTGPVKPCFDEAPAAWVIQGGFLASERHATGDRLQRAYTHNVVFRARILGESGLRFDERWALMGGEDHDFFERTALAGYKIIWADDAMVTEWIPKTRANARWILQRNYRYGNTVVCVEKNLYPDRRPHLYLAVRGAKRLVRGLAFLPFIWPFGRVRAMLELRHICFGLGMLAGWLGTRYEEYRTTHGE